MMFGMWVTPKSTDFDSDLNLFWSYPYFNIFFVKNSP